ncbi:MAG: T9SS type A sorting domain-containing protein, partial [Bacteroidetes bacterium]|nr:T9SS type A sorting domain-containing protein [Bacteroidota bacterium]
WTHSIDSTVDEPYNIIQTVDSGFAIVGSQNYSGFESFIFFIKTDKNGDTLWTKSFGTFGGDAAGSEVIQTVHNGYLIAGTYDSTTNQTFVGIIIRTDSIGNLLWSKLYGGPVGSRFYAFLEYNSNKYLAVGEHQYSAPYDIDAYFVMIDSAGDTVWTKQYGGSNWDAMYSAVLTSNKEIISVGHTKSYGAGNSDVWVVKMDSMGDTLWTRAYGGTQDDFGYSIEKTPDGGFIIAGATENFGADSVDVYLLKIDSVGNLQWQRLFGGSGSDYGVDVKSTVDGGMILTGRRDTNYYGVYVIKLDSNGCLTLEANFTYNFQTSFAVGFIDSSLNSLSWHWSFGDGDTSVLQNPAHTYSSYGTYPVCVIVSNSCYTDTFCDSINILPVGLNYRSDKNLARIYPNPFSSSTTFNFSTALFNSGAPFSVAIYDLFGRQVKKVENINSEIIVIQRDDLRSGMYFYKLLNQFGVLANGKLIIQ